MIEGLLLVDKPINWTSFDVVNYIRKIVAKFEQKKPKNVKVGHTGTLDPFASGLLIVLIGKNYTRRASELTKKDKIYDVEVVLGSNSSTGDKEGEIETFSDIVPDIKEVQLAVKKFTGTISQKPPAYSAIKINGKKSYELAREGKEVDIAPRDVRVYSLDILGYEYPSLKLRTNVSSGTYIRSLAEDIGNELKTGAYCKELRRISIDSKYQVKNTLKIEDLTIDSIKANIQLLA